jgi:hypothetical protein
MKLSLGGILLTLLNAPLVMSTASRNLQGWWNEGGGSCSDHSICGRTPDGQDQFFLVQPETCAELFTCLLDGGGEQCLFDFLYCTTNVE